jgi:Clostripain family
MASDSSAPESSSSNVATSDKKRAPKWTVMVFMGAETIEGNEPLDDAVEADLAEIRSITTVKTDPPLERVVGALNIYVQVHHRAGATQRHRFSFKDQDEKITETIEEIPKGDDEQALIRFITDSIRDSGHGRGDYSMLVLWGHAYDFAFGRSVTRGGVVEAIDFVELSRMLEGLQDRYKELYGDPSGERRTLDIIGFDACDVATVEMACQLQAFAKYLLGSEIGIPIPGWPYDRIFDRLRNPRGRLMAPPEFGSYVVRRFCESYSATSPVSLTLLNLAHAPRLFELAEALAVELAIAIGNPQTRDRIIDLFFGSQTEEGKPFVDVADLCLSLLTAGGGASLVQKALDMGNFLTGPQGKVVGLSDTGQGRPLVAEHGRNAGQLVRLNGLSIYAPHVAPPDDASVVRNLYGKFVFAQKTRWSDLVHNLANLS